jgi:hypothetical protein
MVDRWKFFDGRRMTHVCNRWAKNHSDDLQAAFFNGVGFEVPSPIPPLLLSPLQCHAMAFRMIIARNHLFHLLFPTLSL